MADFKQNYFQKRTKPKGPRTNQRITSQDVQVIASDGDNLGILNLQDAINRAKEYVKAGADIIFPEALKSKEDFQMFQCSFKSHFHKWN